MVINQFRRVVLIFSLLFFSILGFSQTFKITGVVSGYGTSEVKLLKKLKKDVHFEGPIKGVKVSLSSNGYNRRVYTIFDGSFDIEAPVGKNYILKISKKGYASLEYKINSKADARSIYSLNSLLEKDNNNSYLIGTFSTTSKWVSYKKSEGDVNHLKSSNIEIAIKSAKISNIQNKKFENESPDISEIDSVFVDETEFEENTNVDESSSLISNILLKDTVSNQDVEEWQSVIDEAKADLKLLNEDSDEFRNLQIQISLAEQKLEDAKKIITLKNAKIDGHKKVITFLILFLLSVLLIAGLIFYFYKQIKNKNEEIQYKSDKIKSSIEYASLIQKALLNEKDTLQNLIPNSFLFYKPKDVVSGDFYWYRKIENKIVVIVSDCTGHGVPGALITMLGISAIDKIILQEKVLTPSEVLLKLDEEITEKLKDDNPFQLNGMDIAVCIIDEKTKELSYSGAMREIVIIDNNNELTMLKPELASIASGMLKKSIENKIHKLNSGDSVFMFSDGYQDQFNGNVEGVETYNFNRFNELLIKLHEENNFDKNSKKLEQDFSNWKGSKEQTDDVLLLGFKI